MEDNKKNRGLGKGLSELLGEARVKAAMAKQTKVEPNNEVDYPAPTMLNNQNTGTFEESLSKELDSLNNIPEVFIETKNEQELSEPYMSNNNDVEYDDDNHADDYYEDDNDAFETVTSDAPLSIQVSSESFSDTKENIPSLPKEQDIKTLIKDKDTVKIDIPVLENAIRVEKPIVTNNQSEKPIVTNNQQQIIHHLPIELVNPNKEQPRKLFDSNALNDLAASIKVYGIIQPILVNKMGNEYIIVAGERRWRASQIAGLTTIPAIIVNYNEDETLEVALIENIQRANLTPIDEAKAYYYLIHKHELTQNELAQKVGKSRSYVANMVRLLELDDSVKNYLESGELSIGHARVLIGVKNATELAERIVKSNMSVRKVEELVSQLVQKQNVRLPKALNTGKNTDILALEADLRAALGVAVSINPQTSQRGSLVIRYESLEQIDEVCRRLCSNLGADVA